MTESSPRSERNSRLPDGTLQAEGTSRADGAATRRARPGGHGGGVFAGLLTGLLAVALVAACGGRGPETDPLAPAPPDPDAPEPAPSPPLEAWRRLTTDADGIARIPVAAAAVGAEAVFVAYPDELLALGADDGEPLWSLALPGPLSTAPVAVGEFVVLAFDAVVADPRLPALWWVTARDGAVNANLALSLPPITLAALGDDVLLLDDRELQRVGRPEGVDWSIEAPEVTAIRPDASARSVYLSGPGRVDAVDAGSGQRRWRRGLRRAEDPEDGIRLTRVALGDERIFVAGTHDRLVALRARDGDPAWRRDLGTDVVAAPVVTGDVVWTAPLDSGLHGFDAGNGTLLHRQNLSARTYVDLTTLGPWAIVGPLYGPWVRIRPPYDPADEQRPVRDNLVGGSGLRLAPTSGPAGLALVNGDGTVVFMRLPP